MSTIPQLIRTKDTPETRKIREDNIQIWREI